MSLGERGERGGQVVLVFQAIHAPQYRADGIPPRLYRTEQPYRFRATVPTVLSADELEGATPEEVSARINRELEALIRAAPDQYFWLHDRYRDAPPA